MSLEAYWTTVRTADTPKTPLIVAEKPPCSSKATPELLTIRPKEPSVAVTFATPPARSVAFISLPRAIRSLPAFAKPSPPETDSTSEMEVSKPVNENAVVSFAIASANL